MPFQWTAWEFLDAQGHTRGWLGNIARMRAEMAPPLAWVSPYLVVSYAVLVVARVVHWLRTRRAEPVDFLLLLGGLIFAAYFIKLAANFPKYHVGMLPFWCAALAWWLIDWLRAAPRVERLLYLAALVAAVAVFHARVADAWMWTPTLVWRETVWMPALLIFVPAAAAVLVPSWRPDAPRLVAALLVLYVGWALPVDAVQARAPFSTSYYYGTHGQREAAAMLDALGYDGAWVGPKEIAWYARNQNFIDADTFWWLVIAERMPFNGQVLGYDVGVVIPWTMDPDVRWFFAEQLVPRYEPVAEVDNYAAWRKRAPDAPTHALTESELDAP
jgi:hypothetical protein